MSDGKEVNEYIKGEQPAILRRDGEPFKPVKERPPAEIKYVPLGDRDLVIIREHDSLKTLKTHQVALMVNAIKESHPNWCGSVLCLKPDQGFEKMPEGIARKLHRILEGLFGKKAPQYKALDHAFKKYKEKGNKDRLIHAVSEFIGEMED